MDKEEIEEKVWTVTAPSYTTWCLDDARLSPAGTALHIRSEDKLRGKMDSSSQVGVQNSLETIVPIEYIVFKHCVAMLSEKNY